MLSRLLRQVLYFLVHLFVTIYNAASKLYCRIRNKHYKLPNNGVTKNEIDLLLEYLPKLNKKLKHLVVLVDTDNHSISDLAYLMIWSLISGIPYVSFYDITGQMKKYEEQLFLEVERNKKGVPGCIKWSHKPDLNGYTNGRNSAHTLNFNIFCENDGRPIIAHCVREIVEGKLPCQISSNEFTAQQLNDVLSYVYPQIPDPELAIYSGPLCSTHGLLPWQIRLTEFVQISLDYNIDINSYIGALHRYSNCDQRFGK